MRSIFLGLVTTLAITVALTSTAHAGRLGTSTCPTTGNICVGGGGR